MKSEKNWVVYLVSCADHSLYCGITNDVDKRIEQHNRGSGAKYTRSRRPVELLATSACISKSDALKLEHQIKKSPADRKLSFLKRAKDNINMKSTKTLHEISNELYSVVKNLQNLTASVGNIVAAIENMNGEKLSQPKAKRTKRGPIRKKVVMKNGVVEMIKRVPSTKIVYDLLKKSDRGMDIPAIMKATGYDQRKVYNVTYRLKKEGKVKPAERGVYKAL